MRLKRRIAALLALVMAFSSLATFSLAGDYLQPETFNVGGIDNVVVTGLNLEDPPLVGTPAPSVTQSNIATGGVTLVSASWSGLSGGNFAAAPTALTLVVETPNYMFAENVSGVLVGPNPVLGTSTNDWGVNTATIVFNITQPTPEAPGLGITGTVAVTQFVEATGTLYLALTQGHFTDASAGYITDWFAGFPTGLTFHRAATSGNPTNIQVSVGGRPTADGDTTLTVTVPHASHSGVRNSTVTVPQIVTYTAFAVTGNITVSGNLNHAIAGANLALRLPDGFTFNAVTGSAQDVTSWFTGTTPSGLTMSRPVQEAGQATIINFSGTPTSEVVGAMQITIPHGAITQAGVDNNIVVAGGTARTWNIGPAAATEAAIRNDSRPIFLQGGNLPRLTTFAPTTGNTTFNTTLVVPGRFVDERMHAAGFGVTAPLILDLPGNPVFMGVRPGHIYNGIFADGNWGIPGLSIHVISDSRIELIPTSGTWTGLLGLGTTLSIPMQIQIGNGQMGRLDMNLSGGTGFLTGAFGQTLVAAERAAGAIASVIRRGNEGQTGQAGVMVQGAVNALQTGTGAARGIQILEGAVPGFATAEQPANPLRGLTLTIGTPNGPIAFNHRGAYPTAVELAGVSIPLFVNHLEAAAFAGINLTVRNGANDSILVPGATAGQPGFANVNANGIIANLSPRSMDDGVNNYNYAFFSHNMTRINIVFGNIASSPPPHIPRSIMVTQIAVEQRAPHTPAWGEFGITVGSQILTGGNLYGSTGIAGGATAFIDFVNFAQQNVTFAPPSTEAGELRELRAGQTYYENVPREPRQPHAYPTTASTQVPVPASQLDFARAQRGLVGARQINLADNVGLMGGVGVGGGIGLAHGAFTFTVTDAYGEPHPYASLAAVRLNTDFNVHYGQPAGNRGFNNDLFHNVVGNIGAEPTAESVWIQSHATAANVTLRSQMANVMFTADGKSVIVSGMRHYNDLAFELQTWFHISTALSYSGPVYITVDSPVITETVRLADVVSPIEVITETTYVQTGILQQPVSTITIRETAPGNLASGTRLEISIPDLPLGVVGGNNGFWPINASNLSVSGGGLAALPVLTNQISSTISVDITNPSVDEPGEIVLSGLAVSLHFVAQGYYSLVITGNDLADNFGNLINLRRDVAVNQVPTLGPNEPMHRRYAFQGYVAPEYLGVGIDVIAGPGAMVPTLRLPHQTGPHFYVDGEPVQFGGGRQSINITALTNVNGVNVAPNTLYVPFRPIINALTGFTGAPESDGDPIRFITGNPMAGIPHTVHVTLPSGQVATFWVGEHFFMVDGARSYMTSAEGIPVIPFIGNGTIGANASMYLPIRFIAYAFGLEVDNVNNEAVIN
ncbi:MAG: copper amine oxidase N-terminal domain-containing protein [Clostridiales bacterium]|jgi:hypothetical protein|nr:copper amine oxidase N-terminal domain-containing protein [Clostridiales bacterium]